MSLEIIERFNHFVKLCKVNFMVFNIAREWVILNKLCEKQYNPDDNFLFSFKNYNSFHSSIACASPPSPSGLHFL
jgi:hypothetical protein